MLKCENLELPFTADPEPDLSKSLPKYIVILFASCFAENFYD